MLHWYMPGKAYRIICMFASRHVGHDEKHRHAQFSKSLPHARYALYACLPRGMWGAMRSTGMCSSQGHCHMLAYVLYACMPRGMWDTIKSTGMCSSQSHCRMLAYALYAYLPRGMWNTRRSTGMCSSPSHSHTLAYALLRIVLLAFGEHLEQQWRRGSDPSHEPIECYFLERIAPLSGSGCTVVPSSSVK